ncbi:hypothetical protein C8R47DRAFT_138812 [Mycena vitilis]|nr:hypothetical protein C8R47DRAFT_138812 [Mycena vitilis]
MPCLSPPPEILSGFCVECLPTHEHRAPPSPVTPPLPLAQACRHWRSIAILTSELWSYLDLGFPEVGGDGEKFVEDKTIALPETWLARAKGRLLSVKIKSRAPRVPDAVLSRISASGRLHTLDLDLSPDHFPFLGERCRVFPLLKRLSVSSVWEYDPLPIFGNTPSLSELRAAQMSSISHMFPLLTSLKLKKISLANLVHYYGSLPIFIPPQGLKLSVTEPETIPDAKTSARATGTASIS